MENLKKFIHKIEVADGSLGFIHLDYKAMDMKSNETNEREKKSDDYFIDFEYNSFNFFENLLNKCEKAKEKTDKERQKIDVEKRIFIDFCKLKISDSRLKNKTIDGVNNNKTYHNLLEFEGKLNKSLNRNIEMAEEDRREISGELETFLNHLLNYVLSVSSEIELVQNKTAIKIDDKKKNIFIIDVPKIDEFEAKEELRKYIEL